MDDRILEHFLDEFQSGHDLAPSEASSLFDALVLSENQLLLTRVLLAWNEKHYTEDELFEFASLMRQRMRPLKHDLKEIVDIVGTGGSKIKTFNVSTAAAFLVAGQGVPVAKHGNRAATSSSGSSDVLGELGVNVDVDPHETERHLAEYGICFMFAPRFHALSPTLAGARKAVGEPTIFNNLGPLCNPANVQHQLIGVYDPSLLATTARVLARLGTKRSWVICGEGGLDEISPNGPTQVIEVRGTAIEEFTVSPQDFGNTQPWQPEQLSYSSRESALLITEILGAKHRFNPIQDVVLLNAAAALLLSDRVDSLDDAVEFAWDSIAGGHAAKKLRTLQGLGAK